MKHNTHKEEGISILVVEDSLTQAEELRYFLEEHGYRVAVCHDGAEALEWLQGAEALPDVLISDVVMPRMNGYELCKALRGDAHLKELPIILLTSLSEPQDIIKSIEAGANKFLTKPFDHRRLPEVVDELYINTKRRSVERMEMGIRLVFGGNDFLITADKVQILDLLLSSYEESYYQNLQLQQTRSELEQLNAELERKVQERTRELKLQEEQFRTLAEHTPDLIVRIDRNMSLAYANRAVGMLLGVPSTELIGQPVSRLEETITSCPCSVVVSDLFSSGREVRMEYDFQTPEGTKWIDSTFVPEFDEKGTIEYALKVARDITRQKEAEKLLYQKEQAIASSINGIAMADLEGKMTYANDAFLQMWGYESEEEVLGRSVLSFWENEEMAKRAQESMKQGRWVGELTGKKRDGALFDLQGVAHAVWDQHGKVVSAIGFFMDITERKRIETELRENEKMMLMQSKQAAMGEMIAMIAHQWRQPITVISMAANNLQADLALGETVTNEQLQQLIDIVSAQTQYLSKTIDDFRDFFKPTKEKAVTTIGSVLENTLKIVGKSLEDNHIRMELSDRSEAQVSLYANELIQVLLNLINNAKDALKSATKKEKMIAVSVEESGQQIAIHLRDNGGGIPEEVLPRLGEPYFSTKGKNGTGLGLYMSKMIVEKHLGGALSWHNEGEGACFTVTLRSQQG